MHPIQITGAHAREQQLSIQAYAVERRLVRAVRPVREPHAVTRVLARVLVRIARRLDPSVLPRRRPQVASREQRGQVSPAAC